MLFVLSALKSFILKLRKDNHKIRGLEHSIPKNILITTRPLKGALYYDIPEEQVHFLKREASTCVKTIMKRLIS